MSSVLGWNSLRGRVEGRVARVLIDKTDVLTRFPYQGDVTPQRNSSDALKSRLNSVFRARDEFNRYLRKYTGGACVTYIFRHRRRRRSQPVLSILSPATVCRVVYVFVIRILRYNTNARPLGFVSPDSVIVRLCAPLCAFERTMNMRTRALCTAAISPFWLLCHSSRLSLSRLAF